MKRRFKEINFVKNQANKFQFELVLFQDLINKNPNDHSQFEFHKLNFYAIILFTEKEGKYDLNFKEYDFKKGTLFTVRKDNIHRFYKSKAKGILLVFTENFILNHSNESEVSKIFLLFNELLASPKLQLNDPDYTEVISLINLMKKELENAKDNYSLSILRNFIQILITKLLRLKTQENIVFDYNKYLSLFLEFQTLVERECLNYKKVSFYAKEIGVSSKTLNNVTQSIIHKSAKAFINEIVISKSKGLIINNPISLTEIAYQVGFEDPTNFFKYFRKYTGITPKQFRNTYLKSNKG